MRYRRHGLSPLLATAAIGLLCAGCGISGHRTLSSGRLDSQIAKQLKARYPATRVAVKCPSGVDVKAGARFSCTARLDGSSVSLNGTVTSGSGTYNIQPSEPIVVSSRAAATLQEQISFQLHTTVPVQCAPPAFRIVPIGGQFQCTADPPGQSPRPVTITVEDSAGNMRFSLSTG